jgi:hypothetical protein
MRLRHALLCSLAIGLVASSGAANAASRPKPKTLCNMFTDVAGDGTWDFGSPAVKSDALDILGGDIATGAKELVAVLRVKTTANDADTFRETLGYEWLMSGVAGGTRYTFAVRRGLGPSAPYIWTVTVGDTTLGSDAYTFKINPTSFEWHLTRAKVKAMARPKLTWGSWSASTSALSSSADQAENSKNKYPDRAPSCVKAL